MCDVGRLRGVLERFSGQPQSRRSGSTPLSSPFDGRSRRLAVDLASFPIPLGAEERTGHCFTALFTASAKGTPFYVAGHDTYLLACTQRNIELCDNVTQKVCVVVVGLLVDF